MPGPTRTRTAAAVASLAACALALPAAAAVNDILPTDYAALQEGTTNLSLYALNQRLSGPWRDGRLSTNGQLDLRLLALRLSRSFSVGENGQYALAPVLVLPWADGEASGLPPVFGKQASGQGDLRVGLTFWHHVDRVNREYGTVSVFVGLPTGDYDPTRVLNVGENRTRVVLSAGWLTQLGPRWVADVATEVAAYGDNRAYLGSRVLSQDVSYAATGWLRYRVTPALHWMGGAQVNRGGASYVNGTLSTGAPDNTRLSTGLLLFTADQQQWILRYSRDATVRNGFRMEDEVTLRYSVSFR